MATEPVVREEGGLSRIPFTPEAEAQLRRLSFWLGLVGWINVVAAALNVLNLLLPTRSTGHLFNAVINGLVGAWSLQAAQAFQSVATSDVADQAYLVRAFIKLRSIFLLQGLMVLIALAFALAVLLLLVVYAATR